MQIARALNTRNQKVLASQVEIANTMNTRMIGLMGRSSLASDHGMLIKRSGNSIHTFFMKFPIDLVFINAKGEVRWIRENVKPWQMVIAPIFGFTDCLELSAGTVEKTQTQVGDVIRVES